MSIKKWDHYFGISLNTLLGLSLLGVPRVILHDLSLIKEGSLTNSLFVFIPIIIWIGYIVWKNVKRPFLSLVVIGLFYGIFLAISHQIFWDTAFNASIQLGGNLSDLSPLISSMIIRVFAFFSSLTTGVLVGVISGTVTSVIYFLKSVRKK
ncbi:hypothetical protein TEHAL1_06580 [Tetragenococcus halophilus]|uniref:hypothetical protein n=1 Tax=Tetragenococcus halophilus TaxID=51669 RepID=UPI000CC3A309|nr:hypothetical protein [Tetragenococcus halophilus]GBD62734.1 hypothetical protein TEHD23766T_0161 [Tetragenococcus halophilus subsp. flandriensis]GMG60935.1 hypothetical protein TEHAB4_06820 [Tetragenococcus halophilus]GMG63184.1 hypothetical protein TEHAL1_06580 [Tetragenococcus halophilus]